MKKLCADTNRAVNKVKDIFSSFTMSVEERNVVKQLISRDSNVYSLYTEDEKLQPGSIQLGDINSDGYPDLLVTLKYINGSTKSHVLVNEPCGDKECTLKA